MNQERFDLVLEGRISQMRSMLATKSEEYAKGNDRLKNFKDAAALLGETPEQALMGFVAKHIIALKDFVNDPKMQNIPYSYWSEKIGDIINYMVLLDSLIQERQDAD